MSETEATEATGTNEAQNRRVRGAVPDVPRETRWQRFWGPFWMIPAVAVVAALVAGVVIPTLEARDPDDPLFFAFSGGPDAAREVLGVIAAATISVTGLVFSNTLVVLQLVNSSFSPRMLDGFLRSRIVQGTLASFLATFVFSLTVTRYVWNPRDGDDGYVPRISITLAFAMVLVCLGFFLAFIRHILSSMKVANVVSAIGTETLDLAKEMYPVQYDVEGPAQGPTWSPRPGDPRQEVCTGQTGNIVWFDYQKLLSWASENDAVVTIDRSVGEFIVEGQCIMRVWGEGEVTDKDCTVLNDAVGVRLERTMTQDVGFGVRQLVDIADRSLSPGTNDPTTTVQAIQELHRVLRYLVTCVEPSPYIADDEGEVRVVHRPQEIVGFLDDAIAEILNYAEGQAQVPEVMRTMVDDLLVASAERYRPALRRWQKKLAEDTVGTEDDRGGADTNES